MRRLLVHHFLFLWLRAHLLVLPVDHAVGSVEVVCGDLSTMSTAQQIDTDVIGGDVDVSIRHPAMLTGTVDLVQGMQYEVRFTSRNDVMEVQGVAILATPTTSSTESSTQPTVIPTDLSAWPNNYRCELQSSQTVTPSPVQASTSSLSQLAAEPVWTFPTSDTGPQLLASELDLTSTSMSSVPSSLSSSSASSSSPSGVFSPRPMSTSPDGASSSDFLSSDASSSSLPFALSSSSVISSVSSSSVSTPKLEASLPTSGFSEHLPFSLLWTADTITSPCLTLTFVIMVNTSSWIRRSLDLCQPRGCKHYFTSDTGVLQSPGYPDIYPDSSDCTYVIYTRSSSPIELQFQTFGLEQSYSGQCVDRVTVQHVQSTREAMLCGDYNVTQLRQLHYVSDNHTLLLRFLSDNKFSSRGFRALYATSRSKGCDVTHRRLNGTIRSPVRPSTGTYLPNMACHHSIHLPKQYRIRFYLHHLNFSDLLTGACTEHDFLNFRDLDSHNEAKVTCYDDVTAGQLIFESSGSRVEMVFATDYVYQGEGFEVFYVGVPSCQNETFHERSGSVSSVNFPHHYPNMQECFYTLNLTNADVNQMEGDVSNSSDIIEVTFQEFHTESERRDGGGEARLRGELCVRDFVEMWDGRDKYRVCGDWTGRQHLLHFHFRSNFLVFRFVSDEQETRRGFNATWRTLKGDNTTSCHPTWINNGHFSFQVLYQAQSWEDGEEDCMSRGGHLASVLNSSTQDLLNSHLLEQNCSNAKAYWIGGNDRQWESDFYWADGSKVTYTHWFPGFLRAGVQGARYGRQPSDDGQAEEDCVELRRHFALPDKGHTVTESFYWNDRNCRRKNPYICQIQPPATPLQRVDCDKNVSLTTWHPDARLHSPGYPHDPYPDHTHCTIFLHAPPSSVLEFEFWDFQLENASLSGRCDYDYVEISTNQLAAQSADAGNKSCGDWSEKVKLLRHVVTSFYAFLHFHADHSKRFPGFDVTVRMLQGTALCSNSSWIPVTQGCVSVISERMDSQTAQDHCTSASASLWTPETDVELPVVLTHTLAIIDPAGTGVPPRIAVRGTDGTSCLVVSVGASDVIDNVTVVTKVTKSRVSCESDELFYTCFIPNKETNNEPINIAVNNETEGQLRPPLADDGHNYTNNAAITWVLQAPPDYRLLLLLSDVDVEGQERCEYDRIVVKNATPAQPVCGHWEHTLATVSVNNSVEVSFFSDYSRTGTAFTLTWQSLNMVTQCQRRNFTETSATFSSFNFPRPFPDLVHCQDVIRVPEGFLVQLEFTLIHFQDVSRPSATLDLGERSGVGEGELEVGPEDDEEGYRLRRVFISYGNVLKITLSRDALFRGEGFQAFYKTVPRPCILPFDTARLEPNSSSTFLSPNFPLPVPQNMSFNYTLRAPIGYLIHVTFHHFRLRATDGCADVLEMFDVSLPSRTPVPVARLCGGDWANDTVSELNRIMVVFSSGPQEAAERRRRRSSGVDGEAMGFNMTFSALPDPAYLEKTSLLRDSSFDSCAEDPCQHNSTCTERDGAAMCTCHLHYTGLFCQVTWCEVQTCLHGDCELTDSEPGFRCQCWPGHFGAECRMNGTECRKHICHGAGHCVGNSSHVECVCDKTTPQKTGSFCNVTSPDKMMQMTIGQRLLGEPIWIGLIVILSVLFLFGVLCVVRRRCAKRYACCQIQFKRKDPGSRSQGEGKRGGTEGAHPLATFHARRHILRPPSTVATPATPGILRATPTISVTKTEDETELPASTRSPEELKAEVAARFFASYREAERAPISTPLPTDFSKTTDTFLAHNSEESTVGAIVGGTLLHDLHHRKTREDLLSRSCLSLGHIKRRSSSGSSHSHRDRIRRCHSMGGHSSLRQDGGSGGEDNTLGQFRSSPKSRSMDDRDALSLCSDRDDVFMSPRDLRSLSVSPTVHRRLDRRPRAEGGKAQRGREGARKDGGDEGGSSHHLFPEVIVHAIHSQHDGEDTSDGSHEDLTRRYAQQMKLSANTSPDRLGTDGRETGLGTVCLGRSERLLGKSEEDLVDSVKMPGSQSETTLRYKDERTSVMRKLPTRQSRSEQERWARKEDARIMSTEQAFGDVPTDRSEQSAGLDDRNQLVHQHTMDSYLRHKPKYHRAQTYMGFVPRKERTTAYMKRRRTSPLLPNHVVDENYLNHPHYDYRRRSRDEYRQTYELEDAQQRNHYIDHDPSLRYVPDPRQTLDSGDDQKRRGDLYKQRSKHGYKPQSARDKRGMFRRNETVAAVPSTHSARSHSRRPKHARRFRKYSSVDILDAGHQLLPPRARSEDLMNRCQCEECESRSSRSQSSHSSRHRRRVEEASYKRYHKSRSSRESGTRDRRRAYRSQSPRSSDTYTSNRTTRQGLTSLKTSSSENERMFGAASMLERREDLGWEGPEARHRGIEALNSSASEKDIEISRRELFMKFFSQEVDFDDTVQTEQPRVHQGAMDDYAERNAFLQPEPYLSRHATARDTHPETYVHNPEPPDVSPDPPLNRPHDPDPSAPDDHKEQLRVTSYGVNHPHGKRPNVLTSKCSVIMYDEDLRSHVGTRSVSVSNNVSPKRVCREGPPEEPSPDLQSEVVRSSSPTHHHHHHTGPDNDSSSASSEVVHPPHSDPTSLLSVTDTDSAVSSAASQQTSPCSDGVYTSSGTMVTQARSVPKAQDSAYQTKESSMDMFETSRDSRRRRVLTASKADERKVTQRLHQAAIKLFILQQRVRKGRLSRDSAVNTISEDDTGPDSEDFITHCHQSRYRKQMALPEGRALAETEGSEGGIREEEEHDSDLDLTACLNPTPETLPAAVENILEEAAECRECEA